MAEIERHLGHIHKIRALLGDHRRPVHKIRRPMVRACNRCRRFSQKFKWKRTCPHCGGRITAQPMKRYLFEDRINRLARHEQKCEELLLEGLRKFSQRDR